MLCLNYQFFVRFISFVGLSDVNKNGDNYIAFFHAERVRYNIIYFYFIFMHFLSAVLMIDQI